jgi:hypothetical protein
VLSDFVAPTPFLLGNEPAEFGVIRPLREEEDLRFDLLRRHYREHHRPVRLGRVTSTVPLAVE